MKALILLLHTGIIAIVKFKSLVLTVKVIICILVHSFTVQMMFTFQEDDLRLYLIKYQTTVCSLLITEPFLVLGLIILTAYLCFKIFALVKPALFLSMNHTKAEVLILPAVIILWICEYLVKIINNRTICSAKVANFLNTMFQMKIDKSDYEHSLSLEVHIIAICLLQLVYSLIKRFQSAKMHRKTFRNNIAIDVEKGNSNTDVNNANITTICTHVEKENKNRFEKEEPKTGDFLLSGKGTIY